MKNTTEASSEDVFSLIELPEEEIQAGWEHYVQNHILASRLAKLAWGWEPLTLPDLEHLEKCPCCRDTYLAFKK